MKINNNVAAHITNRQLLRNENSLAKSMEKLSTGLRINHAGDDPSGMAISSKMKAQIESLNRASRNSSDGVSVLQTADGALNEVTSMLQRMRELAVQAANGTNTITEKQAMQAEISSLRDEIDRISSSTEFNTKNLLDGSLDTRVYSDHISRQTASSAVSPGEYNLTIDKAATQATITSSNGFVIDGATTITAAEAGTIEINGSVVELKAGMTGMEIYEAVRRGAEIGEADITDIGEVLQFNSTKYGADAELLITFSNDALAAKFGVNTQQLATGTNAKVTLDTTSDFSKQATVALDGNKMVITDNNGFEISFLAEAGYDSTVAPDYGKISMKVTDVGPMDIQIGANEGQSMAVQIPSTRVEDLYLDEIDVTTIHGAVNALDSLDFAINRVNSVRASLGAYQNRLESAVDSLDSTSENMTQAFSRISDTDMATEMVEYTKDNVLTQAATSALSQANELPQTALQLLQ